jgi:hypothetical protein
MDGGDRAGYMQISGVVDSNYITSTMGATTCALPQGWCGIHLLTDKVNLTGITAPGMTGASLIDSETTYSGYGTDWKCTKITMVHVKTGAVIAQTRVLL